MKNADGGMQSTADDGAGYHTPQNGIAKVEKIVWGVAFAFACEIVKEVVPVMLCRNAFHIGGVARFYFVHIANHGFVGQIVFAQQFFLLEDFGFYGLFPQLFAQMFGTVYLMF